MFRKSLNSFLKSFNVKPVLYCLEPRRNYASFTVRDILHETSDESGSLTARFSKHIAMERAKSPILNPTTICYADYFPITDMRMFKNELFAKTPVDQISSVVIFASTYRPNSDPHRFADVLNIVDELLVKKLPEMSTDLILQNLYALLFLMPNWITRLDFYTAAMEQLSIAHNEKIIQSKEEMLQLCFYLGLDKKKSQQSGSRLNITETLKGLLDENLDKYLNDMNSLDIAVVGNALYKTSAPVTNDAFKKRLIEEALRLGTHNGEDALLITLLKTMRFLRIHSTAVCERLAAICLNDDDLQQLQPKGRVHVLAYFAENLWDNEECLKPLIEAILQNLQKQPEGMRAKDVTTFLWCCAQLNSALTTEQCQIIDAIIQRKIQRREFNYFPDQLVDSCLCLWLLGYRSKDLVHNAVQLKASGTAKNQSSRPKVESRLTVLQSAVQVERPDWFATVFQHLTNYKAFDLSAKAPHYLLTSKDFDYTQFFKNLCEKELLSSAEIICPISGINIPSIYGHVNTQTPPVFIEVSLPAFTLKFSNEPVAILRLKIRLLEALNYKVVVLKAQDVENMPQVKNILEAIDNDDVEIKTNN